MPPKAAPTYLGRAELLHRGFDDPPSLADAAGTAEKELAPYRRVRDEIRDYLLALIPELTGLASRPR